MATAVLIPVSEYLATSYRPDCEYIDGEVRERNLGEKPHAGVQAYLAAIFYNNEAEWQLRALLEQRVQISAERFRVPDLCAVRLPDDSGSILRTAPLLCVEILSPGDSIGSLQQRVDDYLLLGVQNIWLIDPVGRMAWTADVTGFHPLADPEFVIEGTPVRIALADLYARLDRIKAGI